MATSPAPTEITFGEFAANLRSRELRRQGARRLPDQSFQVLAMLLGHPGELISREDIQKRLWPGDTFVDFDHGLSCGRHWATRQTHPALLKLWPGYRFGFGASVSLDCACHFCSKFVPKPRR